AGGAIAPDPADTPRPRVPFPPLPRAARRALERYLRCLSSNAPCCNKKSGLRRAHFPKATSKNAARTYPTRGPRSRIGHDEVSMNFLDVVAIFQEFDELEDLRRLLALDRHLGLGGVDQLAFTDLQPPGDQ